MNLEHGIFKNKIRLIMKELVGNSIKGQAKGLIRVLQQAIITLYELLRVRQTISV